MKYKGIHIEPVTAPNGVDEFKIHGGDGRTVYPLSFALEYVDGFAPGYHPEQDARLSPVFYL